MSSPIGGVPDPFDGGSGEPTGDIPGDIPNAIPGRLPGDEIRRGDRRRRRRRPIRVIGRLQFPNKSPEQEATGSRSGRDAVKHPDEDMGPREMRGERLDRRVSEINRSLLQLKEYQDRLRMAEIHSSMERFEQYQKAALRSAGKTLDAARSAIAMERPGRRSLSPEQVRATLTALQDGIWWDELLRSRQLADNDAAKDAAHDLAERIASLEADEISSDSLLILIADIDFLRKEIDLASRQAGLLSPGVARQYITAASSVASQVMVGLVAASTTAEAAGANVVPEVIYSAIGLAVASSMTEIYRRLSRGLKARTVLAQLKEYHYELVGAVGDLVNFMSWLTRSDPGSDPPSEDALGTVRSTCLAAGFLVSHVEQLALSFTWPERGAYRNALHAIRTLLKEAHYVIIGQRYQDTEEAQSKLDNANKRLQEFNVSIDRLG
jgi:hypothetical protein